MYTFAFTNVRKDWDMQNHEDYYNLLGVAKDATKEDIQRAYRKLARKYHPDMNGNSHAEEKFKLINEAHSTLVDPDKRKLYDQYGPNWQEAQHYSNYNNGAQKTENWQDFSSESGYGYHGNPFKEDSYHDFFSHIFDSERMSEQKYNKFYGFRGSDVEAELEVTLAELASSTSKTISWTSMERVNGTIRPKVKSVQVKLPSGLKNGSVIRLAGKGERGTGSEQHGDLLLHIKVLPDARFSADAYDLLTTLYVSPWEAALGGKVEVATLDGKIQLNLPKGTNSGKKLRVSGKGLPKKNGGAGDLLVEIEIHVPKDLSEEEQRLFGDLQKKSRFNPRSGAGQRPTVVHTKP